MPLYTYECAKCQSREEHLVSLSARNTETFSCPECKDPMQRVMDAPVAGKSEFQMKAILEDGSKVSGHFGKAAKKK